MKNLLYITIIALFAIILPSNAAISDNTVNHTGKNPDEILGFDIGDTISPFDSSAYISDTDNYDSWIYDFQSLYEIEKCGVRFIIGQKKASIYKTDCITTLIQLKDKSIAIGPYRIGDVITDSTLLRNHENRVFHSPRPYGLYPFSDSEMTGHNDTIIFVALGNKWFAKVNKKDMKIEHFEKNIKWGYYRYEYER